ncbi:hypothetical protein HispidOSU_012032 [Sigmodon hispidus]
MSKKMEYFASACSSPECGSREPYPDPPGISSSVKKKAIKESAMNVDHEVNLLVEEIHRLGSKNADGKLSVKFGVLF